MTLKTFVTSAAISAALIAMTLASPVASQESEPAEPFACASAPEPVVSLSIGSRYERNSETRSEISEESNEDVNEALKPVEDFINDLSAMANTAYLNKADAKVEADCVMTWLHAWAQGNALTELNSLNARLAVAPRLSGFALAFLQVRDIATPDPVRDATTIAWFQQHADQVMEFFETEAGPLASRNNLRAWAGLATAAIGNITGDLETTQWARESYKLLVCGAEESGALPAEMERGERALHYQLHALAPLTVSIGILDPNKEAEEELCSAKLQKIAQFTIEGVENPEIVAELVGDEQVFSGDDESELASYQLAWAEPYLARYPFEALATYIEPLRPLKYSKLGGNLTEIYRKADPSTTASP
jgi:poly(beta-D-mannuronate) lyase